ncbi:MAG: RNA methyltransferase [Xanthomonadaceae bacterium]|jgi:tRNA (cytidine32/uridine32-2'-O)-methyltransferase|nr:RNA methyltransferase [Xanthomonadaceae bacterium]
MSDSVFSLLKRVRIVLVGTQHSGNIGAAARAMKTMGMAQLALVDPASQLDEVAYRRSAGAEDVLSDATVHTTLADAVADCRLVLGCTARNRRIALEELSPRDAARKVRALIETDTVALVFGRERTGLTNDELQICNASVHIPSDPAFSSLNLAAAVQVMAYEMRVAACADQPPADAVPLHPDSMPANHAQMEGFFTQLAATLDAIDFHKGRSPESVMRKLRRLFLRGDMDVREVKLLRGILADAQRMAKLAQNGTDHAVAPDKPLPER